MLLDATAVIHLASNGIHKRVLTTFCAASAGDRADEVKLETDQIANSVVQSWRTTLVVLRTIIPACADRLTGRQILVDTAVILGYCTVHTLSIDCDSVHVNAIARLLRL